MQTFHQKPWKPGDSGTIKCKEKTQWQPTPVFLPGESMDRGAWQATDHGVVKSQTRLSTHTRKVVSTPNSKFSEDILQE